MRPPHSIDEYDELDDRAQIAEFQVILSQQLK